MTDQPSSNGSHGASVNDETLHHALVRDLLRLAHDEDVGSGDMSASLLADGRSTGTFQVLMKQPGVLAGCQIPELLIPLYGDNLEFHWSSGMEDGVVPETLPTEVATVSGEIATVLTMERVLLNVLQRLCGVATVTRAYVDAVSGTEAQILDTRKTIPGWRHLDKYAVRCGGGRNHRMGLYDAIMIKDNHFSGDDPRLMAAEVFQMLNRVLESGIRPRFVEVEVDTLAQAESMMSVLGVDVILLDNFHPDELREAVSLRDGFGLRGKVALEASGGIDLSTVRAVAETGVERISVGAITHSAMAIDLSMERVA
ncbi:MAG: carboxylating nicotinate-nucleotide diphosphorylase [Phycisphaerae bacterium]